jgi:ketosteroid isomerase-like protein
VTELVERLLTLWRDPIDARPDPEAAFRTLYADPVPVNGVPFTAAQLVARARALQQAFSDRRTELIHELTCDDKLVIGFYLHVRHTGTVQTPVGPVAATGRELSIRTTDILTVRDGLITDIWVIADDLGMLTQLGALG